MTLFIFSATQGLDEQQAIAFIPKVSDEAEIYTSQGKLAKSVVDINLERSCQNKINTIVVSILPKELQKDGPFILTFSLEENEHFLTTSKNAGWSYSSHHTVQYHLGYHLEKNKPIIINLEVETESKNPLKQHFYTINRA